ncbi:MAG TPA: hypothetical protein VEX64_11550, partial [Pyrinomonadaceae bacterium]|nr:hypothetical protein [Pyrinomonadaceae bacterium]
MKRFVFKLVSFFGKVALLLSAFVVGVASTILLSEVSPPTVTLCQLAQYPSLYDGRTIRVEAGGRSIFGWIVIEDETCPSLEAWAGVSPVESYKPSGETKQLFKDSYWESYK